MTRPHDDQFPMLMDRKTTSEYLGIAPNTFDENFRFTDEFKKAQGKLGTKDVWYRPVIKKIMEKLKA